MRDAKNLYCCTTKFCHVKLVRKRSELLSALVSSKYLCSKLIFLNQDNKRAILPRRAFYFTVPSQAVFFLRIWSMFKKKLAASRRKKRSKKNSGRFAAKFVQKKIKPRSKKNAASRPICVQKKIKPCSKKNAASRLICVQKNK